MRWGVDMHSLPVSDPVLIFSIVMLIVLVAPIFAEKAKLPGIIGLIAAGVIIGPHLLGILEKDQSIDLLGKIGLLYIMFLAGLEINMLEVKKNKHHSIGFGLLTFSLPLILGTLGGYYFLEMSFTASVLLASMFSSHTLITFPIVSKLGLAKKSSITSAIGGTIITDTLAFLILAVVVATKSGDSNVLFWIKFVILVLIYVVLTLSLLPIITRWFFKHFASEEGIEEYVFVITMLFILAYLSHLVGLEPVIGAFLTGLTLNSMIPEKSLLMKRIQFVGNSLFIPFFLISVGMIINLKEFISDIKTLKVSLTMIVIAIFSKYIAAHIFGKFIKMKKSESNLVFALTINQAAATLAAVMVGYNMGIFDSSVLTGTIMMIVVTCFFGSILTEKYAKEVIIEEKSNYEVEDHKILDRILIPIKNPHNLKNLMEFTFYIKSSTSNEPVYPLNVSLEGKNLEKQILDGENLLTKAVALANSALKTAIPLNRIDINVSTAISKSIKEQRISKVVFGCSDTGGSQTLFNNVVDQFVKNSKETTYIAKLVNPIGITKSIHLIIPTYMDKQKGFIDTLYTLIQLSKRINAKLNIITNSVIERKIKKIISGKKFMLDYEFHAIDNWKLVYTKLNEEIKKNDMIIQMIARQGQLAWRLAFDKMPHKLRNMFPKNNIVVVYPYYYLEENIFLEEKEIAETPILKDMPESHFVLKEKEVVVENILKNISKEFTDDISIYENLLEVLYKAPIELSKEVLLIHIHIEEISNFEIFVATNNSGFQLKTGTIDSKMIIIMLSPKEKNLKGHLKKLSEIAKLASDQELVENILKANNYEELKLMLD